MTRFGVPGQNNSPLAYADGRLSVVPMVQGPRSPTVNDKKFPIWTEWRVGKDATLPAQEGDFWKLIRFDSSGDAIWVKMNEASTGPVITLSDTAGTKVESDVTGNIQLEGTSGQIDILSDAGNNKLIFSLPGGGTCVDSVDVDFNTAPGTDPVLPDGNGLISVYGNTVTNATNANAPVATHSRALNQFNVDVQLGAAVTATPANAYDAGMLSVDNQFFSTDANGFTALADRMLQFPIGTTINLGISYSSPTFTIHDSEGNALSATNPAFVVMPDNSTKGLKKVFAITSNYSFDDDSGTSDLTGNLWGTTTAIAWGLSMPFYIYMVINDLNDAVTPMIARHTCASQSASTIGKPSSAIADAETDFWALDDSITVGDYTTNPCVRIGVFRMIKNDGANDDWTVEALNNYDGIGRTAFGRNYTFAILQNGATDRYQSSSVGADTLPTFNTDSYTYNFEEGGWVNVLYNTTNITNAPAGAGDYRLHIPVQTRELSWHLNFGGFAWTDVSIGAGAIVPGTVYNTSAPSQYVTFRDLPSFGTASTVATPGLFAIGDGDFSFAFRYRGFLP